MADAPSCKTWDLTGRLATDSAGRGRTIPNQTKPRAEQTRRDAIYRMAVAVAVGGGACSGA